MMKPGMTSTYKPIVYIISAPSGSGESTLVNELLKLVPELDFSISYTTRAPRGSAFIAFNPGADPIRANALEG